MIDMNDVQKIFAFISGCAAALWISLDWGMQLLLILMAIDILVGTILALIQHTLSAKIRFDGLGKKAIILLVVGMAYALDFYIASNANINPPIALGIVGFFCFNEITSIVRNAGRAIPIPQALVDWIAQVYKNQQAAKTLPPAIPAVKK
jgi:toxin secretion/phage lysis holin